ncbi:hypothetical protein [Paraburkholderia sp. MM5496-R1]|uniref:hypothetical protein n=1 Tax=Paraburkholderia sp. MM5496-R1 TaxID=2991065 RepID=UPI003D1D0170
MTSFNPKGDIGAQEERLILLALGLMPSKRFIEKTDITCNAATLETILTDREVTSWKKSNDESPPGRSHLWETPRAPLRSQEVQSYSAN